MCYPVPDCEAHKAQKPVLAAATEEDIRGNSYPYSVDQQGHMIHSTPYGSLPLFKLSPLDKEVPEEYDYGPTVFPETYPQSLIHPTQPSTSSNIISASKGSDRTSSFQSVDRKTKQELREQYGVQDQSADREPVTDSPLRVEETTDRPHTHKDATASWQSSQDVRNVQSVTENANPLHALKSSESFKFPLNQGLGVEKQSKNPHRISESSAHEQRGSKSETHHQNTSDSATPKGSVHQQGVSHPTRGTDGQTNQQRRLDRINSTLYMLRSTESPVYPLGSSHGQREVQGTVTPDNEEGLDEEEMEAEEGEEIVAFHGVTGPEEGDVSYHIKSAQQDDEESESSERNSNYEKTTPEPSTTSFRRPEYMTTSMAHIITTSSTQPPVRFTKDESELSREPAEGRFNHHSEDQEETTDNVFHVKHDEGKSKDQLTDHNALLLTSPPPS